MSEQQTFVVGQRVRVREGLHIPATDRMARVKHILAIEGEIGIIRHCNNETAVAMADFPGGDGINFAYAELSPADPPPTQPDDERIAKMRRGRLGKR